ncbi:hypothetical protein CXB51_019453 [Gossypium anomalum]|uniref:Reverse transcriptase zinc-binding domain-containing protein n=1 Tax=Gossypium anomalum TaxID=47600 RepID=A0A8J5YTE4_9ROSI|nr:hypothetical protein CXB51_019453 [Gossypium anomalum]
MDRRISFLMPFTEVIVLIFGDPFQSLNLECTLRDWVLPDGIWNLDLLRLWLLVDVIKRIASIPPPHLDGGVDRIIWARSGSGSFSIRSAYWALRESSRSSHDEAWKAVWKYQGPQRVCLFLWLAAKHRLLTNSERARRGIGRNSACPLCGHDTEDILHVIRDCSKVKEAWMLVVPTEKLARLWKNRNLFIFQDIIWTAYETIKTSLSWAQHFEPFLGEDRPTTTNSGTRHHLADNWVHLFSDGAVARDSGNASAEGVAEFWGILDGILILLSKGYKKVRVQSDNLEVVKALSMDISVDSGITVLRRIKRLLRSNGQWEFKYITRECNLITDQLAKISLSWKSPLQLFEVPPDLVVSAIQQDKAFRSS